ncbi:ROK family protein [Geomicrobium sp. JCM 19039]|uniref:ROK family protein n=1 Tax=Geomicrobium sp. JCM 19039 TaxID=1460636 RepID=UPI0027D7FAD7|nr:ROK family protein [Geomicrobium sp. JCM 19039]
MVGVGIGVPGIVNHEGEILFAPNLAWENVDLKKQIASQTGLVVTIENEANAGVYAEHLYGLSKGEANLVYVSIGIGIGTGIIINHELYRGSNGISGEMGHMTIEANGQKCRCGNRGCWELYASEKALLDKTDDQNLHVLEEKAKKGDAEVLQRLHDIGVNIGIGLVTIINTFNPEKIIIGNRLARFEPWLNNGIHRSLDQRLPTQNRQSTSVIYSRLGHYSCAKGTASFAIHHFLHEHRVFM